MSLVRRYETLRRKTPEQRREDGDDFWDMVVLSAGNEEQKSSYLRQLDSRRPLLPVGCEIRVYSDPGGERVGDGGSTLHILNVMEEEFGLSRLSSMKILLIHTGGFSKRLSSHSCAGKLFCGAPVQTEEEEGMLYTMLDVKLCNYLPFLGAMRPGDVFLTASDDIESFRLEEQDFQLAISALESEFPPGREAEYLCSLAHPSTLAIGTGHGVFRFSPSDLSQLLGEGSNRSCLLLSDCLEVMQKPTVEEMREAEGMVVVQGNQEEVVFTDSAYWISKGLARKLARFYREESDLVRSSETSMYSDLMTCQGRAGREGKRHVRKLLERTNGDSSSQLKKMVLELMEEVPLRVLALPDSKFFHLGTVPEYLDCLCSEARLERDFSLGKSVGVRYIAKQKEAEDEEVPVIKQKHSELETRPFSREDSGSILGCAMASVLPSKYFKIPERTVVEFSTILNKTVVLNPETVLSGCTVGGRLGIPGGRLYHTTPVRIRGKRRYVTVSFAVGDDPKKELDKEDQDKWEFVPGHKKTLWTARKFQARATPEDSFQCTVESLAPEYNASCCCESESPEELMLCMSDVLELKDDDAILEHRSMMTRL